MNDKDRWYTPPGIIQSLGEFDLDPACDSESPFQTASLMIGPEKDGLKHEWSGRVWCNPPFSNVVPWVDRMIQHNNGVLLVFARSDAVWFQRAVIAGKGCLLLTGRTSFRRPGGNESRCPLGCALIGFGNENKEAIKNSGIRGVFLECL